MPTTVERTARYSEAEKRLVYWLAPNQCRSVEVRDKVEAQELVEDSDIPQIITDDEFGEGVLYTVKTIEGRTPDIRADIYRDVANTGPFEVQVVTYRGRYRSGGHQRFEHEQVGTFGSFEEALACAENLLSTRITGEEFSAALKELRIRQKWLAERLGVAISTVNRWATGALPVAPYVPFVLELLRERIESRSDEETMEPITRTNAQRRNLTLVR